jgi:hypothetical protein
MKSNCNNSPKSVWFCTVQILGVTTAPLSPSFVIMIVVIMITTTTTTTTTTVVVVVVTAANNTKIKNHSLVS